jgi:phosphopantothenoylcysteine decarboxylase / phosphopantothenate---cysteine ligase
MSPVMANDGASSAAPTRRLEGRRVLLGVTGSVAAYKAALLARLLLKEGARVETLLSRSASAFVGHATFGGLTGEPVFSEMFDASAGGELHVELAARADLVLVAPATADCLARLAVGRADDLLAATLLSATCPVVLAPAMHPAMWSHPATQRNVQTLLADGRVAFAGPVMGEVASGETGVGRMAEPEGILEVAITNVLEGACRGRHIVVTAGPTVEDLDAVRFIGNRSSGKMGFAIAEEAARRGARVTLIAGPVSLPAPPRVSRVDVRSAAEMQSALNTVLGDDLSQADALVMAAAVGDFRPETTTREKLKRGNDGFTLRLEQNPDILAGIGARRVGERPVLVGFAVETGSDEDIARYARGKLESKGVDVVIANHAAESMGRDDNRVTFIESDREVPLPTGTKKDVAARIVDWIVERLAPSGDFIE